MTGLYLIAEIGVNHDGSLERAIAMVRDAAAAGFDAVKLQHWRIEELLADDAPTAAYQGPGDQADLLAGLALEVADLGELHRVAQSCAVDFIVTPDGVGALVDVLEAGVEKLKVGSGDADNTWLLDAVAAAALPVLISLGMTDDDGVLAITRRLRTVDDLTLLHCVSAYPTPLREARLGRIRDLAALTHRPIGLSDHTIGHTAAAAAIALGAVCIEKHVTWSTGAPGPDHAMSLPLDGAGSWVAELRAVAAGLDVDVRSADEAANRQVVRKSLHVREPLAAGHVLSVADLVPLRPLADGVPAGDRDDVVGRRLGRPLAGGERLRWSDLEA